VGLKLSCEVKAVPASSYKTFCVAVNKRPSFTQTLKRQGHWNKPCDSGGKRKLLRSRIGSTPRRLLIRHSSSHSEMLALLCLVSRDRCRRDDWRFSSCTTRRVNATNAYGFFSRDNNKRGTALSKQRRGTTCLAPGARCAGFQRRRVSCGRR
jgi:hypothetical protein